MQELPNELSMTQTAQYLATCNVSNKERKVNNILVTF